MQNNDKMKQLEVKGLDSLLDTVKATKETLLNFGGVITLLKETLAPDGQCEEITLSPYARVGLNTILEMTSNKIVEADISLTKSIDEISN